MRVTFTVKVRVRVIQVAILSCNCEATHHVDKNDMQRGLRDLQTDIT